MLHGSCFLLVRTHQHGIVVGKRYSEALCNQLSFITEGDSKRSYVWPTDKLFPGYFKTVLGMRMRVERLIIS